MVSVTPAMVSQGSRPNSDGSSGFNGGGAGMWWAGRLNEMPNATSSFVNKSCQQLYLPLITSQSRIIFLPDMPLVPTLGS